MAEFSFKYFLRFYSINIFGVINVFTTANLASPNISDFNPKYSASYSSFNASLYYRIDLLDFKIC